MVIIQTQQLNDKVCTPPPRRKGWVVNLIHIVYCVSRSPRMRWAVKMHQTQLGWQWLTDKLHHTFHLRATVTVSEANDTISRNQLPHHTAGGSLALTPTVPMSLLMAQTLLVVTLNHKTAPQLHHLNIPEPHNDPTATRTSGGGKNTKLHQLTDWFHFCLNVDEVKNWVFMF